MKKVLIIIGIIAIILVGGVWVYPVRNSIINSISKIFINISNGVYKELTREKISMPNLSGKKIAMIIAFRDFRDEEYFIPKEILEKAGAEIKTASTEKGTAIGADGGEANIDFLIEEINPANFDAIIFVGGPGALRYLDNEKSYQLAQQTLRADRILSAICIAPAILAKAGVLQGKKATVWSSPLDKSAVKILKEKGAIYQSESVVVDGKIVTADGPGAAKDFAQAIIKISE